MAMPLHYYFYRTIGPAVYGGGAAAVVDSNWAEDMALLLDGAETSNWYIDLEQYGYYNDNQATPAKNKNGKKSNPGKGPFTSDLIDYLGTPDDPNAWIQTYVDPYDGMFLNSDGYFTGGALNGCWDSYSANSSASITQSTDSEVAPDGSTPTLCTVNNTSNPYLTFSKASYFDGQGGVGRRYVIWVKDIDAGYLQLQPSTGDANAYANFDISNGTVGTYAGAMSASDTSIDLVTDGYYKITFIYYGTATFVNVKVVDSASAAYTDYTSSTGQQFYFWKMQGCYTFNYDEFLPGFASATYMNAVHPATCDVGGNAIGKRSTFRNAQDTSTFSYTQSPFSNGNWDIENYATLTNCTASSDQDSPFLQSTGDPYQIATLLTASSAGGTGTVKCKFNPVTATAEAPHVHVIFVKPGTFNTFYIQDKGSVLFDGTNYVRYYFDCSAIRAYRADFYEEYHNTGAHLDGPESWELDYSQVVQAQIIKINADWYMVHFMTRKDAPGALDGVELGLCDAVGSTSCSLSGGTLTVLKSNSYYSGGSYPTANAWKLDETHPLNPFVDIPGAFGRILFDDLETDFTTFSMYVKSSSKAATYLSTIVQGSSSYPDYRIAGTNFYCRASSSLYSGVVGTSSTLPSTLFQAMDIGRPGGLASTMSAAANDFATWHLDRAGSKDTSGTMPTASTYLFIGPTLLKRIGWFNRAISDAELETLTEAKVPATVDTANVTNVDVKVAVVGGDVATQLEVDAVVVQVLRSTAGT